MLYIDSNEADFATSWPILVGQMATGADLGRPMMARRNSHGAFEVMTELPLTLTLNRDGTATRTVEIETDDGVTYEFTTYRAGQELSRQVKVLRALEEE